MLPDGWDGGHVADIWEGPTMVHAHEWGKPYAVTRAYRREAEGFVGWYVNIAEPWRRSGDGIDSRDLVLDVVGADDLRSWSWKDEDELDWSVSVGKLSIAEATNIRACGRAAVADLEARAGAFAGPNWTVWKGCVARIESVDR